MGDPVLLREFTSQYRDPTFQDLAGRQLNRLEMRAWQQAVTVATIESLSAYIRTWADDGRHVEEARRRLTELEDDAAWNDAISANTIVTLRAYLARFSKGVTRVKLDSVWMSLKMRLPGSRQNGKTIRQVTGCIWARG